MSEEILNEPIDPAFKAQNDRRLELEQDALRVALSSRGGRRFIWSLLGKCGMGQNPKGPDNDWTNFNCGRQSVAADLMVDIETVDQDAYLTMLKEAKEDNAYVNTGNAPQRKFKRTREQYDSIAAHQSGTI